MVYFNDNYIDTASLPIQASNRAFKYGDGLFESCLIFEGNIPLLRYHISRLRRGMELLGITIFPHWDANYFKSIFQELARAHGLQTARAKITVWRGGEGLYLPVQNTPELLIEIFPLSTTPFSTAPISLHLGVYNGLTKVVHPISGCKTCNALPYVMAAQYAAAQALDDALVLNTDGEIADAISSNVFIVRNGQLITTPALNGGVVGTMQQWLVDHAEDLGYSIQRIPLKPDDLLHADAVFLTNAIQGIRPVTMFNETSFSNKMPLALLHDIRALLLV